jgi:cytochrome-b5 reductase
MCSVHPRQQVTAALTCPLPLYLQISLIYANVTEDDILLRSELDFKARIGGDKFKVFYTLDKPPEGASRLHNAVSLRPSGPLP